MTAKVLLSDLRNKSGFTQREVAIETGLTEKTIGQAERQQHLAAISTLARLAKLYGVAIDDIVDKEFHLSNGTTTNNTLDREEANDEAPLFQSWL